MSKRQIVKSLLHKGGGRSEIVRESRFCTRKAMAKRLIVRDLPQGILTATTKGLEGSDEKGNVEVGNRASSTKVNTSY